MTLTGRAVAVAGDRDAGASEILRRLLPVLDEAVAAGPAVTRDVVRAICRMQPGMASLWNACAAAVASAGEPARFARVRAGLERAPAALGRVAAGMLDDLSLGVDVPRFVTLSYSGSVLEALAGAARVRAVEVVCAESRPRYEGRRLAAALARAGAHVTVTTDAAVTSLLDAATAVVVGADAVTTRHWINKVGTRSLAAAAGAAGVPVAVIASSDKFLPHALESFLTLEAGAGSDVWADAPPGVQVANPVFEPIPLDLATLLVTDRGIVAPSSAGDLTEASGADAARLIRLLVDSEMM